MLMTVKGSFLYTFIANLFDIVSKYIYDLKTEKSLFLMYYRC